MNRYLNFMTLLRHTPIVLFKNQWHGQFTLM